MKQKHYIIAFAALFLCGFIVAQKSFEHWLEETEEERYENPRGFMEWDYKRIADPATGKVPPNGKYLASLYTKQQQQQLSTQKTSAWAPWVERGPTTDATGPSNGNIRQTASTGPSTAGRTRSILVDANDGTGNTVWTGGVNGGLWKTTNYTAASPTWGLIDDFFANLAITSIAQDPSALNTMYFCTGEMFFNADAVQGAGVWKSTNGGATWAQVASSVGFTFCSKIVCDAAGNIYLGTSAGLKRSTNGGTTWVDITPTGASTRITDLEMTSTGRLHMTSGLFAAVTYRFTSIPTTVAAGTWTTPTTAFPTGAERVEIGGKGNNLYALPGNGAGVVATIYKTTDGGANWAACGSTPGFTSGQAWYCLGVDVDPTNGNNVVVGSLDCYKSTDGGATWAQISDWVGAPVGDYVHADIQTIVYSDANNIHVGCDGGVFYSANAGGSFASKNTGIRIKQFYSCAIHPATTNYFLAGAQDNGSHQFNNAGLSNTIEVMGGDGCFVHIDQDQPAFQWVSYVYNNYRTSINSGATWTSQNIGNTGQFVNPTDYDDANNIMYCSDNAGSYRRWTNPQSGGAAVSAVVAITGFGGGNVTAVKVASPFTNHRVYFGTDNGRVVYVSTANVIASGSAGTNISGAGFPAGDVSCIEFGTTEQNIIVTFSNYGVSNVWVTTNGGAAWTAIDGTLPNMPVRWAMFYPGDDTRAIIATEAGVYATPLINAGATQWFPSVSFPIVRTDMLQYRTVDQTIAAATHGRGLWTNDVQYVLPFNGPKLKAVWENKLTSSLSWELENPRTNTTYEIELSTNNVNFSKVGSVDYDGKSNYTFKHNPQPTKTMYYRIRELDKDGASRLSNVVVLNSNPNDFGLHINSIFPNPIQNECMIDFEVPTSGNAQIDIYSFTGQKVFTQIVEVSAFGKYRQSLNLTSLATGTYLLNLQFGNRSVQQKIVKF